MQLIRTETGRWALLEMDDEDVSNIYYAASEYASTLARERATATIHGKPAGPEDQEFLAWAAPKAERVWKGVQAATESILERAGLI